MLSVVFRSPSESIRMLTPMLAPALKPRLRMPRGHRNVLPTAVPSELTPGSKTGTPSRGKDAQRKPKRYKPREAEAIVMSLARALSK